MLKFKYNLFFRSKENGLDLHLDSPHPAKRHHSSHQISPVSSSRVSPGSTFNLSTGPIRLEDISKSREMRERMEREQMERERTDRERDRHFTSYSKSMPLGLGLFFLNSS